MRTTLQIDDDMLRAAKSIAAAENKTIGEVVSALMRKALAPQPYRAGEEDIPCFRVSENIAPLTSDMVRDAEEDAG
jgi:hypothetical protein